MIMARHVAGHGSMLDLPNQRHVDDQSIRHELIEELPDLSRIMHLQIRYRLRSTQITALCEEMDKLACAVHAIIQFLVTKAPSHIFV